MTQRATCRALRSLAVNPPRHSTTDSPTRA